MKHYNQRNIKIIDELLSFYYKYGADKIDLSIETHDNETIIHTKAEIINLNPSILQKLNKLLNTPRRFDIEEYCWELTGDNEAGSELLLVGIMTDEATVNYMDSRYLEIVLKRKI